MQIFLLASNLLISCRGGCLKKFAYELSTAVYSRIDKIAKRTPIKLRDHITHVIRVYLHLQSGLRILVIARLCIESGIQIIYILPDDHNYK